MTGQDLDEGRGRFATPAEVVAAVEALTDVELYRVESYAAIKLQGLGDAGRGLDPGDLVQEAFEKTLRGRRRWNKGAVDLVGHLTGVIWSETAHRRERAKKEPPTQTAADLHRPFDSDEDPLESRPSQALDPERRMIDRQRVERIRALFAEDPEISLILDGLADRMPGPEIQEALGLSATQYWTAMRRMRRGLERVARKGQYDAKA